MLTDLQWAKAQKQALHQAHLLQPTLDREDARQFILIYIAEHYRQGLKIETLAYWGRLHWLENNHLLHRQKRITFLPLSDAVTEGWGDYDSSFEEIDNQILSRNLVAQLPTTLRKVGMKWASQEPEKAMPQLMHSLIYKFRQTGEFSRLSDVYKEYNQ